MPPVRVANFGKIAGGLRCELLRADACRKTGCPKEVYETEHFDDRAMERLRDRVSGEVSAGLTFREKNKTFRAQISRSGDLCFRIERKERNRIDFYERSAQSCGRKNNIPSGTITAMHFII